MSIIGGNKAEEPPNKDRSKSTTEETPCQNALNKYQRSQQSELPPTPTTTPEKEEEDGDFPWDDLNLDDAALQQLLDAPHQHDNSRLRSQAQHAGFDNNAGENWIYPNNLPERDYQFTISQAALYRNTLVVLPTGLGKTFIAAVVMYNIYRWYPRGKVIFMAPTRPLVAQQIEACQRIMPFPAADTVELTGKLPRARRTALWHSKRVFFATPQVVLSDILGSEAEAALDFPFSLVKLLVVDEAHKAKGHPYADLMPAMLQRNAYFRVLALSATPGRTFEDVAEVVRNLLISHLEVRWDTSSDVAPHLHERKMRTIVVPIGDDIRTVYDELLQIIDPYLRQLNEAEALGGSHSAQMTRNSLIRAQKHYREKNQRQAQNSAVSSNFSICISLYYALELLERHGLRVFLNSFEEDEEGRAKFVVNMDRRLRALIVRLRAQLGPNPFDVSAHAMTNGKIAEMPTNLDFGHPKFEQARACLVAHFQENPDSRAIVFCEYRESVMLIYRLLLQHVPLLKPRCFVGQGGTTGPLRALTQKQQIQTMNDFRSGKSNILVATSIGEEGIDVGEVELIVCFDISTSNPTRFTQRIGRTGRRKNGNVVMLVTEGREQQLLKNVLASKDRTNKKLLESVVVRSELYKNSPRMVPTEYNPQCLRTFVKPPVEEVVIEEIEKNSKKFKGKQVSKLPLKGNQDLRKFFYKPILQAPLEAEDMEIFQMCTDPTQAPSTQTQHQSKKSCHKIKDFFTDIDMSSIMPTTNTQMLCTQPLINSKHLKYLRKVDRLLKTTPVVPPSELIEDVWEQLRSKKLSRESKLLMLQLKPELIREARERFEIVTSVDDDKALMSKEEQEVRENYQVIEDLCGGSKDALATFLEDNEYEHYKRKCSACEDPYADEITEEEAIEEEAAFMACVDRIFEGGPAPDWRTDNFDYIQQELKKTERYHEMINKKPKTPPLAAESMVFDTLLEPEMAINATQIPFDDNLTESKYCSQWDEFARVELTNKSTPLQGPLVRAFKRQEIKVKTSNLLQRLEESRESVEEKEDVMVVMQEENSLAVIRKPNEEIRNLQGERKTIANGKSANINQDNSNLSKNVMKSVEMSADRLDKVPKKIYDNIEDEIYVPDEKKNILKSKIKNSQLDIDISSDDSNNVICGPEENDHNLSKSKELNTNTSSSKLQTKTESSVRNQIVTNDDSTPDDLELSLHKLSTVLIKQAVASTPNLDDRPLKELKKVEDVLHEKNKSVLNELDFDMDLFMEPFPEEEMLIANFSIKDEPSKPTETLCPIAKNVKTNGLLRPLEEARHSPDLFDWDEEAGSPVKAKLKTPSKLSLAAKLAAKTVKAPICTSIQQHTPPKLAVTVVKTAVTPKSQPIAHSQKYETSPSLFDMYLKHTRQRGAPVPKSPLVVNKTSNCDSPGDDVIRKPHVRKRKILDSDSENEPNQCGVAELVHQSESDNEEIAATQQKRHKKPRRLAANSFVHHEAAVSGSEQSEDDAEYTLGHYVHDTVVVSSEGEPEPDAASTSHQQAMYLQSVKSPMQSRGAFKIPTFRVYNDHSQVYSQVLPVEQSQYLPNSFVVAEEDDDVLNPPEANVSLCPLERAEKILKERRRAKRQFSRVAFVNSRKKRKVCRLADDENSSGSDDGFK